MIRIVNILLTIGVFVAGYFLYRTIQEPIEFNAEFMKRDVVVKEKLKYIRDLQLSYKDIHGDFTSSFDSLVLFYKQDSMSFKKVIGDPDKLDAYGNPVKVSYKTFKIAIKDTLVNKQFPIDNLANIPGVEGEKFSLETSEITRGRITVPVFLVSASYPQMLKGLNRNYIDPTMVRSVGSLEEPSYNGNWEGK